MTYLKSLFLNFLTVFFADHIIPGIQIEYYTKLPHIGGDIIFAASIGFLNSLIFPILRLVTDPSHFKIGLISFIISFGAYSIVNLLPIGVHLDTAGAYLWCGGVVWFVSYLTNHMEYRRWAREQEFKRQLEEQEEEHEEELRKHKNKQ